MRRLSIVISIFLLLSIWLSSCGGGEKKETSQESEKKTPAESPAPQGQRMFTWAFIPIYPGATQEKADVITGHPQYQVFQIRQFAAPDSPAQAHEFYLAQMPEKGWTNFEKSETEGVYQSTWGTEDKNVMCWVKAQEHSSGSGTALEIIRAKGKSK